MAGVFADAEYVFASKRMEINQFRQKIGDKPLHDFFEQYAFDAHRLTAIYVMDEQGNIYAAYPDEPTSPESDPAFSSTSGW